MKKYIDVFSSIEDDNKKKINVTGNSGVAKGKQGGRPPRAPN